MPLMGFREYARHREAAGYVGGKLSSVQAAIKSGRISGAVVEVDGRQQIDQAKADALWAETTNGGQATREGKPLGPQDTGQRQVAGPARAGSSAEQPAPTTTAARTSPPAAAGGEAQDIADNPELDLDGASYATARAARERANARLAQIELAEKEGRLVDADLVASSWEKVISVSRTKVLALPSKIRARLPKLTAEDVAVIEQQVRETLEELAAGAAA